MILTKEQVLERLLANKPISITRFGDGESIILNATTSVANFHLASEAVLRRQMGYDPTVKQLEEIRQNLIDCYSTADVIGVSCHKQKTDSHWQKSFKVLLENAPNHTEQLCDIDVAYQMLEDGSYDRLLQNRKVLNYISCRDLDEGFKRRWNVGITNKYQIAPEAKFTSGYNGEPHYPNQFNKAARWLDVMKERHPGSLLFVGAGVIGKIYCNWWRDRGGVAFDCGGVFDIWAGRITRGPDRGLDKEDTDTKYKL